MFLRSQIQDLDLPLCPNHVLTAPKLDLQSSSIRSTVDSSLFKNLEVVNKRQGFYLQFDNVDLPPESDFEFENEKFVYE